MQRTSTLLPLLCFAAFASAQHVAPGGLVAERVEQIRSTGVRFRTIPLFNTVERLAVTDQRWSRALNAAEVIRMDRSVTSALLHERDAYVSLELPEGGRTIVLDLERLDITTDDFRVTLASTGMAADLDVGMHFRGAVRGVPGSMAAISVFPDEVMGLLSDDSGERVLGRLADDTQGDHVFYHERDLRAESGKACHATDEDMGADHRDDTSVASERTVKCVRYYWEVNYDIFQGKGSVANAVNYVTGLFNQSAILYANDGISVALSEVYVWDVPSPYTSSSTSTQLSTFGSTRTSFNGDMAHLLGYTGGGGVAWLNTICSSQARYRMAYSDINSTYQNVPTYSWSVEVVTHEQGHNLGSAHTHACAWNGNNTAIDGCGPAAGYSEGSCAAGPVPTSAVGGTIMSYCHLTGTGIKFSNGFGPQPAERIISRINAASCLTACGSGAPCAVPTNLAVSGITTSGATLGWSAASGATSYTLQWRAGSAVAWTTVSGVTTTSYTLSGLGAGTAHQFQVMTVCASGSSSYASPVSFTTTSVAVTCGVPTGLSASGITSISATLNWASVNGAVSYTVRWRAGTSGTWTTIPGITGTSRSLTELSAGRSHQFQVMSVCSAGSSAYSSSTGFTTSAAATCGVPTGLSVSGVTTTSATLNWAAVSGAVSYTVQWRAGSSGSWTTITGIAGTSRAVQGLNAATAYQFQVRAVCATGNSSYSTTFNFSTPSQACSDDYEPNNARNNAWTIPVNSSITGLIDHRYDSDWLRFANTTSAPSIRVRLTGLPANYSLTLYRGATIVGTSNAPGTGNEVILLNNAVVATDYVVRVAGVSGAFSVTRCYTLQVEISGMSFMPEGMPEEASIGGGSGVPALITNMYPNPASGLVMLEWPMTGEVTTVELIDGVGRVVSATAHEASSGSMGAAISVADHPAGLYFVRVSRAGGTEVRRLMVSH